MFGLIITGSSVRESVKQGKILNPSSKVSLECSHLLLTKQDALLINYLPLTISTHQEYLCLIFHLQPNFY